MQNVSQTVHPLDEQWEELQEILSHYTGEWTSPDYPGAVNSRIPNTALLGNGNVGISSDGSEHLKSFHLSKGDFWEYNNRPLRIGTISVGIPPEENADNPVPSEAVDFHETEDILQILRYCKSTIMRLSTNSAAASGREKLPPVCMASGTPTIRQTGIRISI